MSTGRLSAFAALNNSDSDHSDDDEIIRYEQDQPIQQQPLQPLKVDFGIIDPPPSRSQSNPIPRSTSFSASNNNNNISTIPIITTSKFKPNDDNMIFNDSYVIIGLKVNEYLMVKGSYKLIIQRGSVQLDSIIYHSNPGNLIPVNASSLVSIPLIAATQVTNMDLTNDEMTEENQHLFHSDYKSIVKIMDWNNGLNSIGKLYPQLKNVYPIWEQDDGEDGDGSHDQEQINDYEKLFYNYSFKVIISKSFNLATSIIKSWKLQIDNLLNEFKLSQEEGNDFKILVIGSKNSGKSTFLRLLLNNLTTLEEFNDINLLDIDPGQPEYSLPDCISLTNHSEPIFGLNLPFTKGSNEKIVKNTYIGFNTPQREPINYMNKIRHLVELNNNKPILINSPGWIKGFGIQILKNLTDFIKPTHLIYLTNNLSEDIEVENELINNLKFDKLVKIQGCYLNSQDIIRYSPAQIRNFKILSYLHYDSQNDDFKFDPLITNSPLKISYSDNIDDDESLLKFKGISMCVVLDSFDLNTDDLIEVLECQTVGLFAINLEEFQNLVNKLKSTEGQLVQAGNGLPNLITDSNSINEFQFEFEFLGLGLVHSINVSRKYLNLYTPIDPNLLKSKFGNNEYKLVLIKGRSDPLPIEEFFPKLLLSKGGSSNSKSDKKRKLKMMRDGFPYISFSSNVGKGGKVLNVRRNIMRRGQQ